MYNEILEELNFISDENFARWQRPFLNLNEDSEEILLGIRVPLLRKMAKRYQNIDMELIQKLLDSNIHEAKSLAIFVMLIQVKKEPIQVSELYLKKLDKINNWDLIDYSAPYIVAPYVNITVLRELACSGYLWANRVAMVSTIHYIRQGNFELALDFAEKFILHKHHLMHKAAGWMLREVGKKDVDVLLKFLKKNSKSMPAIMKSYAKEKIRDLYK